MTIYTRDGDDGETSLYDGERIAKDAARIEVLRGDRRIKLTAGVWFGPSRFLRRSTPCSRGFSTSCSTLGQRWPSVDPRAAEDGDCRPRDTSQALEADIDRLDATLEAASDADTARRESCPRRWRIAPRAVLSPAPNGGLVALAPRRRRDALARPVGLYESTRRPAVLFSPGRPIGDAGAGGRCMAGRAARPEKGVVSPGSRLALR